jgi:TonB family protein
MKYMFSFLIGMSLIAPLASGAPAKQDGSQATDDPVYVLRNVGDSGITAPKPVYQPDAEYTDRARRKKISGSVVVSFVVTREGTVRDAKVARSLDKELDQQALAAVSKWKFEPATKDGKPVSVRINADMTFRIR